MKDLKNHSLIKEINRAKILDTIRRNPMVARSQIAQKTGLDKKSITNFVNELLTEGLIEEAGRKENVSGRPFTMLRFCESYVAGIHIAPRFTRGVLLDLYGNIVSSYEEEYPIFSPRETIVEAIKNVYVRLTFGNSAISGIGLCLPGIIDLESGIVLESVNLPGIRGLNYREAFAEIIKHPFYVEEGSAAIALAEKWFGRGRDYDDFVCVEVSGGIGSGIIYQRRLFKGAGKYAGEIGHVVITPGGKLCQCGNHGCLEAYTSETALLLEINKLLPKPIDRLYYYQTGSISQAEFKRLRECTGMAIGHGLAAMVNILSPRVIILTGSVVTLFGDELLKSIRRGITESSLRGCAQNTKIYISEIELLDAMGAATLPLARIFEVPDYYYV
ncbi:MAG: ROK family transcriptional regulator [Victivallaceae bacterium]|nr:ROK family transcriptional regulator [Victivallaceae bacterium]